MKLRIRNVAKIEEADLELNGITIIAGNNNTGKSTIGKIVFSLFNSLVNLEEKIVKQKRDLIYQILKRNLEAEPKYPSLCIDISSIFLFKRCHFVYKLV